MSRARNLFFPGAGTLDPPEPEEQPCPCCGTRECNYLVIDRMGVVVGCNRCTDWIDVNDYYVSIQ